MNAISNVPVAATNNDRGRHVTGLRRRNRADVLDAINEPNFANPGVLLVLARRYPSAVTGRVVAFIVSTIKFGPIRSFADIGNELFKVDVLAGDAPASVIFPLPIVRVAAAISQRSPCLICLCFGQPVLGRGGQQFLSPKASAGGSAAIAEGSQLGGNYGSAVAFAKRLWVFGVLDDCLNDEPAETVTWFVVLHSRSLHRVAHICKSIHGKGKSIKASDVFVAALCFTHHSQLDQGSTLSREQRQELWTAAWVKTVAELVRRGLWPQGVPVPDTSPINRLETHE